MNRLITALSVLFLSMSVFAASGTLKAQLTSLNTQLIYTFDGSNYGLTSMSGKAITILSGSGMLEGYNQNEETDLSQAMPDAGKGESIVTSLERTGINTANMHSRVIKKSAAGDINFTETIEVELVAGSWADYDAGKEVKIQLTKKGIEQDRAAQKKLGNQLVGNLTSALQKQGVRVSNASIDIKTSETDIYTLSKVQLVQAQAFVQINIEMTLYKY